MWLFEGENRRNPYLTRRLRSQIVEILTLRAPYVTSSLRNRLNREVTRSLLISACLKMFTCSLPQFWAFRNIWHATWKCVWVSTQTFSSISKRRTCCENDFCHLAQHRITSVCIHVFPFLLVNPGVYSNTPKFGISWNPLVWAHITSWVGVVLMVAIKGTVHLWASICAYPRYPRVSTRVCGQHIIISLSAGAHFDRFPPMLFCPTRSFF